MSIYHPIPCTVTKVMLTPGSHRRNSGILQQIHSICVPPATKRQYSSRHNRTETWVRRFTMGLKAQWAHRWARSGRPRGGHLGFGNLTLSAALHLLPPPRALPHRTRLGVRRRWEGTSRRADRSTAARPEWRWWTDFTIGRRAAAIWRTAGSICRRRSWLAAGVFLGAGKERK
jgi:hypothetical protein